jgi:hypothetical protein
MAHPYGGPPIVATRVEFFDPETNEPVLLKRIVSSEFGKVNESASRV